MKNVISFTGYAMAMAASLLLSACGGSDNSGPTQATISDTNEQQLAVAATEAARQAANNQKYLAIASGFLTQGAARDSSAIEKLTQTLISNNQANSASTTVNCDSGSFTYTQTIGSATYSVANCRYDGITYNGTVTLSATGSGAGITGVTVKSTNFTITAGGVTDSINLSGTCTIDTATNAISCTFDAAVNGFDGRTYTISNLEVSGDDMSGYTVSATVTDPDYGQITIETTAPVVLCGNVPDSGEINVPNSGEITVTAANGDTMTITYNGCASFTVTRNGVANTYSWSAILPAT